MTIGEKARQLERKLARTVNAAIGELVGRDEPSPLEIVHAVLERAEHEVQEIGRGRHVFPFTCVRLLIAAPARDRHVRARVEAVIAGPPSLAERLAERLRSAGCGDPMIAIDVQFVRQPGSDWEDPRFHVVFERLLPSRPSAPGPDARPSASALPGSPASAGAAHRVGRTRAAGPPASAAAIIVSADSPESAGASGSVAASTRRAGAGVQLTETATTRAPHQAEGAIPRLKLTVLKGATDQRAYAFAGGRVDIGRRAEVVDQRQRLIRTNQIAFLDDEAADNRSVSRRHAHVEFVGSEGGYRLWDDRSAHGTSVVRGGRTMKVPAGARGLRLATGDEIVLGQARLKVSIG